MADDAMGAAEVAVVGNGPWGAVLADLLCGTHERVLFWGEDDAAQAAVIDRRCHPGLADVVLSDKIEGAKSLGDCASAQVIIIALAPDRVRPVVRRLGDFLRGDHRVLCASRGLEPDSGKRLTQVVKEESCVRLVAALAGPQLTLEMAQGAPGGGVVGSEFKDVAREMQGRLASARYRVYTSADLVGVEYGPVFASIGVFVVGVVEGFGLGTGAQALVMSRAVVEIGHIGAALGGAPETFSGMSSLGVLMGACLARTGVDYQLGLEVGRNHAKPLDLGAMDNASGLMESARLAAGLANSCSVDAPLLKAAAALLSGAMTPDQLRVALMTRPLTEEQ